MSFSSMFDDCVGLHILKMFVVLTLLHWTVLSLSCSAFPVPKGPGIWGGHVFPCVFVCLCTWKLGRIRIPGVWWRGSHSYRVYQEGTKTYFKVLISSSKSWMSCPPEELLLWSSWQCLFPPEPEPSMLGTGSWRSTTWAWRANRWARPFTCCRWQERPSPSRSRSRQRVSSAAGLGRGRLTPAGTLGHGAGTAGGFCPVVEGGMRQCGHGHGWALWENVCFLKFRLTDEKKETQSLSVVMETDETAGLLAIVIV